MKKIFSLFIASLFIGLSIPASATSIGVYCWHIPGPNETVCFDVWNHGFVYELTGTICAPNDNTYAPLEGAAVLDTAFTGMLVLEFTRIMGTPMIDHGQVHHTVARIDPCTLSGTWEDQHGAAGTFTFLGPGPLPCP